MTPPPCTRTTTTTTLSCLGLCCFPLLSRCLLLVLLLTLLRFRLPLLPLRLRLQQHARRRSVQQRAASLASYQSRVCCRHAPLYMGVSLVDAVSPSLQSSGFCCCTCHALSKRHMAAPGQASTCGCPWITHVMLCHKLAATARHGAKGLVCPRAIAWCTKADSIACEWVKQALSSHRCVTFA